MPEKIAIVGGTGAEGSGLAARFARAGQRVFIGSRNPEKAAAAAREIQQRAGSGGVTGHTNAEAASLGTIVILTVPLSAHSETLKSIRGSLRAESILVDATVPLEVAIGGRVSRVLTLWDGSAAQRAARLVPFGIAVVAAFHSLSADVLGRLEENVDCDALICGDSVEAKRRVGEFAEMIPGVRAIDAGPLENARYLEISAAMLIALNLQHKVRNSGLRITGLLRSSDTPGEK
jgi:8-hydroxy-5-deazaflavin:NADPH oxidoreductase